jgi:hypothetical protein
LEGGTEFGCKEFRLLNHDRSKDDDSASDVNAVGQWFEWPHADLLDA